jgi:hypothetical protein
MRWKLDEKIEGLQFGIIKFCSRSGETERVLVRIISLDNGIINCQIEDEPHSFDIIEMNQGITLVYLNKERNIYTRIVGKIILSGKSPASLHSSPDPSFIKIKIKHYKCFKKNNSGDYSAIHSGLLINY